MNSLRFLSLLLLLLLVGTTTAAAQTQYQYVVDPASRFWIEGSATTGGFTCEADDVDGYGRVVAPQPASEATQEAQIELSVPVQTFDCGNRRMNDDLRAALQSKQHPVIQYTLDEVQTIAEPTADAPYRLLATGKLTIAGTERSVTVTLNGKALADGRMEATGEVPLQMSDFGITPPTALLGLVRVRDDIQVRFQLLATVMLSASTETTPSGRF